jgi:hypothetical protein
VLSYYGGNVRYIVDLDTLPVNDDYVVSYDADADKFYMKADATGAGGGAPTDADYLVGTANGSLSAEIVVGTTPGGELGGTWASPTIDDTGITLTSVTIGSLLGVDSIDATGAVDMDYGSADITDHTFVSDGGTVIIDGNINSSTLTASEIVVTDGSKNLVSAAVATYPSLAELAYVKGVTSAIQTQLNAKPKGATSFNLPVYSAKLTGAFVVFTPPAADACAAGAQIDAGDGNWRLLFDASTDECATWQFIMPNNYASAPLLDVMFSMTSGESNEVEFEAAIMCYTPTTDTDNIGTASFSNVAVAATTVSATAGEAYLATITLTDDTCAAGDIVFIVLSTDANDETNDDATGDREVVGVSFRYTGAL